MFGFGTSLWTEDRLRQWLLLDIVMGKTFSNKSRMRQRQVVDRTASYIGWRMNGMGSRNGIGHTALVRHVVVLMGRLVVAIAEDSKGTFGLGRRQWRLLGEFSQDRRLGWREANFRNRV